jgi:hypothetical protein
MKFAALLAKWQRGNHSFKPAKTLSKSGNGKQQLGI